MFCPQQLYWHPVAFLALILTNLKVLFDALHSTADFHHSLFVLRGKEGGSRGTVGAHQPYSAHWHPRHEFFSDSAGVLYASGTCCPLGVPMMLYIPSCCWPVFIGILTIRNGLFCVTLKLPHRHFVRGVQQRKRAVYPQCLSFCMHMRS